MKLLFIILFSPYILHAQIIHPVLNSQKYAPDTVYIKKVDIHTFIPPLINNDTLYYDGVLFFNGEFYQDPQSKYDIKGSYKLINPVKYDTNDISYFGEGNISSYRASDYRLIDSSRGDKYFVFNYKKVPEKGLYIDSVVYKDRFGKFYIIAAFMDQQMVLNVRQYVRKTSVNTLDIFIDKKYKLKP
jgi:hypothetical protein